MLDNACKYSDEKTDIKVSLKYDKGRSILEVNNKGNVIPKEDIEKLFDRFYRSEKSRVRKEGGYGLGLSIANSIVKAHNGKIDICSNIEEGTTFRVVI